MSRFTDRDDGKKFDKQGDNQGDAGNASYTNNYLRKGRIIIVVTFRIILNRKERMQQCWSNNQKTFQKGAYYNQV